MLDEVITGRRGRDDDTARLAVLIDADNAQAAVIEGLLGEIARFGEATVKRIYGDFTSPQSASWKKVLQKHAIKPIQQFAYTTGKNVTDSALIIDAMDLLYTRRFDGFCLISSDSDFTGLALRLREAGLLVLGFGEEKTPAPFRNACHKFIFTEVLRPEQRKARSSGGGTAKASAAPKGHPLPKDFLIEALESAADDSGWANLGGFGTYLNKRQSDFDARNYGYRKLSDLVRAASDIFEIEERQAKDSSQRDIWIRAR